MRYQINLTILNQGFKKKDHLQNSKQNYFFLNLIEMWRTRIYSYTYLEYDIISNIKNIKLKGAWFYFYKTLLQDTEFVLTNHDIHKLLHCTSALYTSWRQIVTLHCTSLKTSSILKIITFSGYVFPVINPNRLTRARRTVEKKVRKQDDSEVKNKKP